MKTNEKKLLEYLEEYVGERETTIASMEKEAADSAASSSFFPGTGRILPAGISDRHFLLLR